LSRPAAGEEEVSIMIEFDIRPSAHPVPDAEREAMLVSPGFGQLFTDHMITARWSAGAGWHDARLEPYGPFTLDPATSVFHYSQEFFEGLKAYRQDNGSIAMFRPDANAARFNASARRMAMPELPEETFIRALELLVAQDREWVPAGEGNSLYLRPFMIATQPGLGVNHPSNEYLFCVIASPAASYFSGGVKPVTVWLSQDYTRAAPGGTGAVKTGGNYAAAFVAQQQAVDRGCDQVVWLDAAEHRWVEEMGGMNLFFVRTDPGSGPGSGPGSDPAAAPVITTPPLTGTLLPGITRDSLLRLAPDLGITARQERISIEQWQAQCASGELTEVFACGTAAVITPVGRVKGESAEWVIADGEPGPVTMRLRGELIGIQYGRCPDPFGWVHKVC
jgi:branched-chain amino acid aminotransferase